MAASMALELPLLLAPLTVACTLLSVLATQGKPPVSPLRGLSALTWGCSSLRRGGLGTLSAASLQSPRLAVGADSGQSHCGFGLFLCLPVLGTLFSIISKVAFVMRECCPLVCFLKQIQCKVLQ